MTHDYAIGSPAVDAATSTRRSGQPGAFWLSVQIDGSSTVIRAGGEFDLAARQRFDRFSARLPHIPRHLVLDMREVSFMDLSGLCALMEMRASTVAVGGDLVIRCPANRCAVSSRSRA